MMEKDTPPLRRETVTHRSIRQQIMSSISGKRAPHRWSNSLAVLAFVITGIALVQSFCATDAATTAVQQVNRARADVAEVVYQANQGHASLRTDIERNARDIDTCHRRATLLGAAIDAVARTQPGRSRAPRLLDEAGELARPQ